MLDGGEESARSSFSGLPKIAGSTCHRPGRIPRASPLFFAFISALLGASIAVLTGEEGGRWL